MHLPVQMVSGFSDYLGRQDVFQYLLMCWAIGFLTVLLILIIFLNIYLLTINLSVSLMISTIGLIAEFLMNRMISTASSFAFLKNYNMIHLLEIAGNTNGANSFVSVFAALCFLTFACICFLMILTLLYSRRKEPKTLLLPLNIRFSSLFQCIGADIYIHRKYILIMLLLGLYIAADIRSYHRTESSFERSVEQMREKFYGQINDQKLAELEERKQEYDALKDELASMHERFILNELSEQEQLRFDEISMLIADSDAFDAVYNEIRTIADNHGTYYLNAEGIRLILQTDSQWYRTLIFFLILVPSVLFAGMTGRNLYHSPITAIMFTSRKLKSCLKTSINYLFINSFIMIIAVYGGRVVKFSEYYSFSAADAPVNLFLNIDSTIPLKIYLLIYFTAIFLVVSLLSLLTVCFSQRYHMMQSTLMTAVIAFVLYILPCGIMKGLTPDLEGSRLLFFIIPISCSLIFFLYRILLRGKEEC